MLSIPSLLYLNVHLPQSLKQIFRGSKMSIREDTSSELQKIKTKTSHMIERNCFQRSSDKTQDRALVDFQPIDILFKVFLINGNSSSELVVRMYKKENTFM
jgi:hypothetical protein